MDDLSRTGSFRGAWLAVVFLFFGAVLAACKREPHESATSADPASSAASPASPAAAPAPEFHEEYFDLVIRAAASYAAGRPASLEVVLTPKNGYHPNDKYPYKLKLVDEPGVKYAAPIVTREAVSLEPTRATMKVDLVAESAGTKRVAGQFSFSLCSAERCLVEKRDLATTIRVD